MDNPIVGTVVAIWRYPIKSMLGESLEHADFTKQGVPFDRMYALRDPSTGKRATARQFPQLLQHKAAVSNLDGHQDVVITFPDGSSLPAVDTKVPALLSTDLQRTVLLEEAWQENTPKGNFDDSAVHILTLQTLRFLQKQSPQSLFDPRRFRANLVVDTGDESDLPEQAWVGHNLMIGDAMISIRKPCERCVMTTMPQDELPKDNDVLKTVVSVANSIVGIYGDVSHPGRISIGDVVRMGN